MTQIEAEQLPLWVWRNLSRDIFSSMTSIYTDVTNIHSSDGKWGYNLVLNASQSNASPRRDYRASVQNPHEK